MPTALNSAPRLGVNIDHVATLRQLRNTPYPDLMDAARKVAEAGAHQITVHLREDRRHIQDRDVEALLKAGFLPLNLEMCVAPAIVRIATKLKPHWACLVPERRQEVTTEGGLNLKTAGKKIGGVIEKLKRAEVRVSLFIEPTVVAVRQSHKLGADAVELHTGAYSLLTQAKAPASKVSKEIERISEAAGVGKELGLRVHAGHGLDYQNVRALVDLGQIEEYNIGHSIVCQAAMVGMERAVREMVSAIQSP